MRKVLLGILSILLVLLLLAMACDLSIWRVGGNPTTIKNLLANSGLYNHVVNSALDQAQKNVGAANEISLNDPAVKSAAESVFTPQLVESSTNQAIDSTYSWLNGKTQQPDFSIDLSAQKTELAQKVAQLAQEHASGLPICRSVPAFIDPLSVTCLPPGITPAQVGEQAKNDILNSQGFLNNPVITADDIKRSGTNQPVFSGQFQKAPRLYQQAKNDRVILIILTVVIALATIFISARKRYGLQLVGGSLIVAGVLLLLFAIVDTQISNSLSSRVEVSNAVLQGDIQSVIKALVHNFIESLQLFGGGYIALGLFGIGASLLLGGRSRKARSKV